MKNRIEDDVAIRQNSGTLGHQIIAEFPLRVHQMSQRASRLSFNDRFSAHIHDNLGRNCVNGNLEDEDAQV